MPGTPTTKLGIQTLDPTGVDALVDFPAEFNAAMGVVDSKTTGYVQTTYATRPSAGVSGRWHRSTDAPNIAMDTGATWTELIPLLVTSLPGSPYDGQEVYYIADSTNGVLWHLRYRSLASTHKWEGVGGSPLTAEVTTFDNVTATTFGDPASHPGPSITVPLAGDYEISYSIGSLGTGTSGPLPPQIQATLQFGATPDAAAVVAASINAASGSGVSVPAGRPSLRRAVTAGQVVKVVYEMGQAGQVGLVGWRSLAIRPIRVG